MKFAVFFLFAILACAVNCYRILVVFPMAARSHYILGSTLARGLAEAGHDVTMLSPFKEKNPPKNGTYRDVVLTGFLELRQKQFQINFFDMEHMNPFLSIPFMNSVGNSATKRIFEHPNFKKLIEANESFDAVILQQFNTDGLKALAHYYKASLILFSPIGANGWINPLVGNPAPPSYIPDILLKYSSSMTFCERVVNTLFTVMAELNRQWVLIPAQNKIMKEHFPDAPDLSILNYNASLVLVNGHESISQATPHVPSMVDIGGFHVKPPKELPKDLKDFIEGAKEGVVYFSMGSNIKPSDMSSDKKDAILGAMGKLKQKVLWKWDEDDLPGKPDNVKLSKWFPQQDVLAHPNTKLFITHGGFSSTTETIYHGVPVLALPVFGDQKMNAARAEMNGVGISLEFSHITEEKLTEALNKLLNDPKYRDNAKIKSRLMNDRPIKPMDLAVYWTEFVIRHKGAPHLRVAALDLPWYTYFLLDVILFFILVGITVIVCFYLLIRSCCKNRARKDKIKNN